MSGFLDSFPVFLASFPPDLLDSEGRAILEADTVAHRSYLDAVKYVPCTLNDVRKDGVLPMNMEALKRVQTLGSIWKRSFANFDSLARRPHLDVMQNMLGAADAHYCLPYVVHYAGRPLSETAGNLFRFFRGVGHYARHRLLHGHEVAAETMYEYTLSRALFSSVRGVCPASKVLTDRVDSDLLAIVEAPVAKAVDLEHCGYDEQDMMPAIRLGAAFELFGVMCALLYGCAVRRADSTGAPSIAQPFPLPCINWLRANYHGGPMPAPLMRGLHLLASRAWASPSQAAVLDLLARCNQPNIEPELIEMSAMLNAEVAGVLGRDVVKSQGSIASAVRKVIDSNLPRRA